MRIKLGKHKFKNKSTLTNFVLGTVRTNTFYESLKGDAKDVFMELLKFHPDKKKANADVVEIYIGPNAKGYPRGKSPYMKMADGKVDSFSILECIRKMPYEKTLNKEEHRPTGPARYSIFMESGKAWAKCSYCNESLDGEPLRLNPNPDARKPAICIPCFDGMRDIPETDGEGTGIADGKTSEFMEELVRTGREGMEGIDTPEHREVLGVIKDVLEAVNRGRERGSFHLFPRSRSIFGRWGLVYSIEDDGKYGGSLLTIGMSSGNHYPVVVQVQGEWTANAADLVELEGKLIEAFQTESVRTWLYWKNHLMEGRK